MDARVGGCVDVRVRACVFFLKKVVGWEEEEEEEEDTVKKQPSGRHCWLGRGGRGRLW